MTRRVVYVTGTRADFGLMRRTLAEIEGRAGLDLSLVVTGMHLSPGHGRTVSEIEASGFTIRDLVPAEHADDGETDDAGAMSAAIGRLVVALSRSFAAERPDMVLLLGDRGEMLAGAIAALHAGAAGVHIHGGERSGTVDEPVRHAISKLCHLHLAATEDAAERLRRLGEDAWRIRVVGAPGLDDIGARGGRDRAALCAEAGLDPARPVAVVLFHPVVQDAAAGGQQMTAVLAAVAAEGLQMLLLAPNSDAGGVAVRRAADRFAEVSPVALRRETHLSRAAYLDWLAAADLLIGNSSSGVIESASLGIPCVNVGDRQNARLRNPNVFDVPDYRPASLAAGIRQALAAGRGEYANLWGDGRTAPRIADFLENADLTPDVFRKLNSY